MLLEASGRSVGRVMPLKSGDIVNRSVNLGNTEVVTGEMGLFVVVDVGLVRMVLFRDLMVSS